MWRIKVSKTYHSKSFLIGLISMTLISLKSNLINPNKAGWQTCKKVKSLLAWPKIFLCLHINIYNKCNIILQFYSCYIHASRARLAHLHIKLNLNCIAAEDRWPEQNNSFTFQAVLQILDIQQTLLDTCTLIYHC
jgi:hypothetical protein